MKYLDDLTSAGQLWVLGSKYERIFKVAVRMNLSSGYLMGPFDLYYSKQIEIGGRFLLNGDFSVQLVRYISYWAHL